MATGLMPASGRLLARRDGVVIRARAPLRLGLAGGGSDVSPYCDEYGGAILNVTIDKFANATVQSRSDGIVQFRSADMDFEESFDVASVKPGDARLKLHYGVYRRMMDEFNGGENIALSLWSEVEAPTGSGLGSSSSLVVALVMALSQMLAVPLGEYDLARLAFSIEREDLGLAGGKQDQYAAAFGGFNFMEFYAKNRVVVNPLRIRPDIHCELESSILLVFTGQSRQSAKIIDAQAKSIQSGGKSLEAMHQLTREAKEMKEALLFGNMPAVGEILQRGWEAKKRTSSAVSSPEVEELFDIAMRNGALAGKLSGAGGGGFALFLIEPALRSHVARLIEERTSGKAETCRLIIEGATSWEYPQWSA
jgi:D-glycero-alpha-D-manno-heptose-7-phosphate kinase